MLSIMTRLLLLATVGLAVTQLSVGVPVEHSNALATAGTLSQRHLLAAPAAIKLTSTDCPALIKQGQLSGCVTRLQQLLNKWGGVTLTVDGDFGPLTFAAVKKYQTNKGLDVDGIVGPQTKNSLETLYGTAAPPPTDPPTGVADKIVFYAKQVAAGKAVGSWKGGFVPYSWGGGHKATAGPSKGTCVGYTGPAPCKATSTVGVDCSGFARWIYYLAYGKDKLGSGNTDSQKAKTKKVTSPLPGDLVFYGKPADVHHVGIYIGNNFIINALKTGTVVKKDTIRGAGSDFIGYYRLQ